MSLIVLYFLHNTFSFYIDVVWTLSTRGVTRAYWTRAILHWSEVLLPWLLNVSGGKWLLKWQWKYSQSWFPAVACVLLCNRSRIRVRSQELHYEVTWTLRVTNILGPHPLPYFTKYKSLVLRFEAWTRKDISTALNKSSMAKFTVVG